MRLPRSPWPSILILIAMLYPVELLLARLGAPWWLEAACVLGVVAAFVVLVRVDREE